MSKYSIVEYLSDHAGYECGYCKQKDTNFSHVEFRGRRQGYSCGYCGSKTNKFSTGMWAHNLTVEDYQRLIDRGWRRSGKYVYKPTMDKTCCPQYTIRCPVSEFHMSKSHKKIIKRNNKFFNTGIGPSKQQLQEDDDGQMASLSACCDQLSTAQHEVPMPMCDVEQPTGVASVQSQPTTSVTQPISQNKGKNTSSPDLVSSQTAPCVKKKPKPGQGPDPNKPKCVKAKLLRMQRKMQKESQCGKPKELSKHNNEPKPLEMFLNEIRPDAAHKLEIRLVRSSPRSLPFEQTFHESYMVYKKYQMAIHNDPADKPTEKQYTRFLVDSPLEAVYDDEGKHDGFGSFHQQYLLDGKIIAVGVLDILPNSVSSVYLYYDPDYAFLSPGTYSALREIAFVRHLNSLVPSVKYYYMGFYIHSCPKMRYKGQYNPSYLLCPETYDWFPIEKCTPKLDINKYSRFDETGKEDEDGNGDIREVLCLHMRQVMPYIIYQKLNKNRDDAAEVSEYMKLVGMTCAKRMLLYRPPSITTSDNDDDDDDDD